MRIERGLVAVDLDQQEERRVVGILVHVEPQAAAGLEVQAVAGVLSISGKPTRSSLSSRLRRHVQRRVTLGGCRG